MVKRAHPALAALALVATLGMSLPASADSLEDSFQECNYPKMTDALIMRPVATFGLALGITALGFLTLFPPTTIPTLREWNDVSDTLVVNPIRFIVARPLGTCAGVDRTY